MFLCWFSCLALKACDLITRTVTITISTQFSTTVSELGNDNDNVADIGRREMEEIDTLLSCRNRREDLWVGFKVWASRTHA